MLKLRFTRGVGVPVRLQLTPEQHEALRAWGARHPEWWQPRPPEPPDYAARRAAAHEAPRKVSPRERPALAHPAPGPEALSDDVVAAWVAVHPFIRGGLGPATQRAMAYIETFRKGAA